MHPIDPGTDLTETCIEGVSVYRGNLLHVRRDRVRLPDGTESTREYIVHPGAVAMVALLDDGRVVMERQYRYPLGGDLLELPAGKIDPGEEPLVTAKRELLEETGYVASSWALLTTMEPLAAYSSERIHIYLARGLERRVRQLDDGEFLEVFAEPLSALLEGVRSGRITDAKTQIGLFWAEKVLAGDWTGRPA